MTFRYPQRSSFGDPAGGIAIEATALDSRRRNIDVSFAIRASSARPATPWRRS